MLPDIDGDAILPPIHKIQPIKPKINRRRKDKDEVHNPYRMKRNQTNLRCTHYPQLEHNRRTCKNNQRPPGVATDIVRRQLTLTTVRWQLTRARARQQILAKRGYLNSFKFFP